MYFLNSLCSPEAKAREAKSSGKEEEIETEMVIFSDQFDQSVKLRDSQVHTITSSSKHHDVNSEIFDQGDCDEFTEVSKVSLHASPFNLRSPANNNLFAIEEEIEPISDEEEEVTRVAVAPLKFDKKKNPLFFDQLSDKSRYVYTPKKSSSGSFLNQSRGKSGYYPRPSQSYNVLSPPDPVVLLKKLDIKASPPRSEIDMEQDRSSPENVSEEDNTTSFPDMESSFGAVSGSSQQLLNLSTDAANTSGEIESSMSKLTDEKDEGNTQVTASSPRKRRYAPIRTTPKVAHTDLPWGRIFAHNPYVPCTSDCNVTWTGSKFTRELHMTCCAVSDLFDLDTCQNFVRENQKAMERFMADTSYDVHKRRSARSKSK